MTATVQPTPALRHALRGREYFTLAFGSMVGVGWLVVIDDWLARGGSAGARCGVPSALPGNVIVLSTWRSDNRQTWI